MQLMLASKSSLLLTKSRLPSACYPLLKRSYVSKTPSHSNTAANLMVDTPAAGTTNGNSVLAPPNSVNFLQTLPKKELFQLGCIGVATLNSFFLNTIIKFFPYIPMPIIKLFVSSLYCGGENFKEVIECGERLQKRGISNMMLSLTIENSEGTKSLNSTPVDHIVDETIRSVHNILLPNIVRQLDSGTKSVNDIAPGYIALKPSALVDNPHEVLFNFSNPAFKTQRDQLIDNCSKITKEIFDLNQALLKKYPERKAPFLVSTIDAEKYDLQENGVYELQRILFQKFNPVSSRLVSCIGTWQLYLRDSGDHLLHELKLAQENNYKLGLKLVRGAYIHSENNRNQIIFGEKNGTDENYDRIITQVVNDLIINGEDSYYGHLVVASHNYQSQMLVTNLLKSTQDNSYAKSNIVLGQLLGMADNVTHDLITNHGAKNIIKYVPWGPPLETKDYLLRRLQENGDAVRSDNGWPLIKAIAKSIPKRLGL
ncbi:proline dehydrogenase [Saccharomyces eubayanus]|uniref:proline dehydrogenase n=1 Tax=Saccharomyces eubayanus TaxID=1080349 RepID=UPI0006C72A7F|nr:PUT1-like protein [Saccharomyces eubayanus]KOG97848.1 PUT1-like protein [Saccharomyces eubayanus]